MYKLEPFFERAIRKIPGFWKQLESYKPLPEISTEELAGHVVIIGYGRIGKHMVDVLKLLNVPLLVIESDIERIEALNNHEIATLYGDAANSEVITHAYLSTARALVVTFPDETSAFIIVASARSLNPKLPIIARAATEEGVHNLAELGADRIVHPELEGGLEIVHHTLLELGFPLRQVHEYAESVRRDQYEIQINSTDEHRSLHDLLIATDSIEITWLTLSEDSPIAGQTLLEANIRSRSGASVVALIREDRLIANPKSSTRFEAGDRIGLIGEKEQIDTAQGWLSAAVDNVQS